MRFVEHSIDRLQTKHGVKSISDRGRRVDKWAPKREIYFASEFSETPIRTELFLDDNAVGGRKASGKNLKIVLYSRPEVPSW